MTLAISILELLVLLRGMKYRRAKRADAHASGCDERTGPLMRSKLALALLAGALAIPTLYAQGPGPDGGQGGPAGGPGAQQHMGPGGPEGGWRGQGGWQHGGVRGMRGRHRGHRGGRREFGLARIAANPEMREKLGLTPEQVTKINQQTSEFRKTSIRSRADLEVKRVELGDLLRAESPDRAAIDRKLDEIGAARTAEMKAQLHYRLAMREVLTPEQRKKLQEMHEAHRNHGIHGRPGAAPRGPKGDRPPAPNQE